MIKKAFYSVSLLILLFLLNGCGFKPILTGSDYNFSIKISNDDIREYSFTNFERAEYMRRVMIGHLKAKIEKDRAAI